MLSRGTVRTPVAADSWELGTSTGALLTVVRLTFVTLVTFVTFVTFVMLF